MNESGAVDAMVNQSTVRCLAALWCQNAPTLLRQQQTNVTDADDLLLL